MEGARRGCSRPGHRQGAWREKGGMIVRAESEYLIEWSLASDDWTECPDSDYLMTTHYANLALGVEIQTSAPIPRYGYRYRKVPRDPFKKAMILAQLEANKCGGT